MLRKLATAMLDISDELPVTVKILETMLNVLEKISPFIICKNPVFKLAELVYPGCQGLCPRCEVLEGCCK
jgi:hypothetical protein